MAAGVAAVAVLGLASIVEVGTPSEARLQYSIQCNVFHRTSASASLQGRRVQLAEQRREADIRAGPFAFRASLHVDSTEADSLSVEVVGRARGHTETRALYQFGRDGPENQFRGKHGFTGLIYTHLPPGAELQYFCQRRRGG